VALDEDEVGVPPEHEVVPLRLTSVRIRRFRSLHDVTIPIEPGMTVLTGENDGGKTTVLDALAFLLDGTAPTLEERTHGSGNGEPIEVEAVLVSDQGDKSGLRVRAIVEPEEGSSREILDRVHQAFGAAPAALTIGDLRSKMRELGIDMPGGSVKAPIVEAAEAWLGDRPESELEDSWRRVAADELQRLPSLTRFQSVTAPSPRADIQSVVQKEAQRLLGDERYERRLSELSKELDRDAQGALDRIREKVLEYCPDLEDVVISGSFDFARPGLILDIRVRRAGQAVDLDQEGEGRKRKITLAIHEANLGILEEESVTRGEVIAYDEPDTHLDYSSQRQLFNILERQAELGGVHVIVATHSLNFIDRVPLRSVVHLKLDNEVRTQVELLHTDEHEEELRFLESVGAGLGLRNSVLLDERSFLVVEGETEEAAVPEIFRLVTGRSLTSAGVTLINTRGSGPVRQIVNLVRREWGRRMLLLADEDQRDRVERWAAELALTEGTDLFFIGTKEFEDAFGDDVWLETLRAQFPLDGEDDWTLDEIREARAEERGMGVGLLILVSRRRGERVTKPDLGFALGRMLDDASLLPKVLNECLDAARSAAESS
jgi:putative ATP-dependent endonuclease of OLD family